MREQQIERRYTLAADLYFGLYGLIALAIVSSAVATYSDPTLAFGAFILLVIPGVSYLLVRYFYIGTLLQRHTDGLQAVAASRGWQWLPGDLNPVAGSAFGSMSLQLLAERDRYFINTLSTPAWDYADWRYATYQKTKNGEYKSADVYYGIMSAPLSRIMPNVFFDSKASRRTQFKVAFTADQRHSLEGDFDNYFDTYFAEGYTIDSLSFVTPDVMQTLIAASDYDIEIVQDRVLLYGPIYIDPAKLDDMAAKLQAIQKQVNEQAETYRDDRLPFAAGAQTVTPQGMFLRRRRKPWWPSVVLIAVYFIIQILIHNTR